MKILDCETFKTTLISVSQILGVKAESLSHTLKSIELSDDIDEDACTFVLNEVRKAHGIGEFSIDKICWFHLARSFTVDSYASGIKDLGTILPDIISKLHVMSKTKLSREQWLQTFDDKKAWMFTLKTGDAFYYGPYAMLVRESAFRFDDIGNNDYLGIPEIVEDIARATDKTRMLLRAYKKATRPLIVKFLFDAEGREENCLSTALLYLYNKIHREKMSLMSNTCFDGEGQSIEPEKILKVEDVTREYVCTRIRIILKKILRFIPQTIGIIQCRRIHIKLESKWFGKDNRPNDN